MIASTGCSELNLLMAEDFLVVASFDNLNRTVCEILAMSSIIKRGRLILYVGNLSLIFKRGQVHPGRLDPLYILLGP